jgi:hypothetical protein
VRRRPPPQGASERAALPLFQVFVGRIAGDEHQQGLLPIPFPSLPSYCALPVPSFLLREIEHSEP